MRLQYLVHNGGILVVGYRGIIIDGTIEFSKPIKLGTAYITTNIIAKQ